MDICLGYILAFALRKREVRVPVASEVAAATVFGVFKSKTDKRGGGLEKTEFTDTIKRADFFGYIIKGTGTAKRILRGAGAPCKNNPADYIPSMLKKTHGAFIFLRSSLRSRGQDSSGSALGACKVI